MVSSSLRSDLIVENQNQHVIDQVPLHRSASVISDDDDKEDDNGSYSGYSADQEERSLLFWESSFMIDLAHSGRRRRENDTSKRLKRRKLDQNNFAASNAAADLARAGLLYPKISTTIPRIAPDIDLSSVRLISANSSQASSFLYSVTKECSSNQTNPFASPDDSASIQCLLRHSAPAYQLSSSIKIQTKIFSDQGDIKTNCAPSAITGTGSFSKATHLPKQAIKLRTNCDGLHGSSIPAQAIA